MDPYFAITSVREGGTVRSAAIKNGRRPASPVCGMKWPTALRGAGRVHPAAPGISSSHAPDLNVLTLRR
jgi:hypothetical protein